MIWRDKRNSKQFDLLLGLVTPHIHKKDRAFQRVNDLCWHYASWPLANNCIFLIFVDAENTRSLGSRRSRIQLREWQFPNCIGAMWWGKLHPILTASFIITKERIASYWWVSQTPSTSCCTPMLGGMDDFNRLSRARRIIENVFGMMSARFRVLRKPIDFIAKKTKKVALACCVLHNFMITTNKQKYASVNSLDHYNNINDELILDEWRREVQQSTGSMFSLQFTYSPKRCQMPKKSSLRKILC